MTYKIELGEDKLGQNGDAFYEMLMKAHEELSEQESHALNIRLVLVMANHIGDLQTLEAIINASSQLKG